jgi:hypothetical protein
VTHVSTKFNSRHFFRHRVIQCTSDIKTRRVHVTIVDVLKQQVLRTDVSVGLITQQAKGMSHTTLSFVVSLALINGKIFGKKSYYT